MSAESSRRYADTSRRYWETVHSQLSDLDLLSFKRLQVPENGVILALLTRDESYFRHIVNRCGFMDEHVGFEMFEDEPSGVEEPISEWEINHTGKHTVAGRIINASGEACGSVTLDFKLPSTDLVYSKPPGWPFIIGSGGAAWTDRTKIKPKSLPL